MYNKKYRLVEVESFSTYNPVHDNIRDKICYLAYLKEGERGWFLCETDNMFDPIHRIHTSTVKDVLYTRDNQIIVRTRNTKYVFKLILSEEEQQDEYWQEVGILG